jgi:hypothetical protein
MARKKDPESCGECIFCLSKCPKCRSTDVEIRYIAEYALANEKKNRLEIQQTGSNVELECENCGESFFGPSEQLDPLLLALDKHLAVATHTIEIDHHGAISTTQEGPLSKTGSTASRKKTKSQKR